MSAATSPQGTLVHSYLFLRRAIGVIGLALPEVLIIGKLLIDGGGVQGSISGYYYTDLRGVFVGSMCAMGVFLLSYRGYGPLDDIAGNVVAVAAIGLALFPTAPADPTGAQRVIGTVHLVLSAVFFLTLAFFCLYLFPRTDATEPTPRKIQRNRVYVTTGVVMLACLVLIAISDWVLGNAIESLHPALWLESVAILAFGLAWLTKGEAILADLSPTGRGPILQKAPEQTAS